MDTFNALLERLKQFKASFLALPTPQKVFTLAASGLALAGLITLFVLNNRVEYTPLYSGLSESDMASITETLKKTKVPYKLSSGSISIPKDQLYEVRMSLAAEGIPKGQGTGFEIFDQQKLGSTDFVQKINYQRALQGELARTINEMNEVAESRVHLALPEETLFTEDQKPPSAAIVLKLQPGARLSQRQIQGIVHLVASSVKGLEEDKVTIMSTDGQVIFKKDASNDPLQMTATHLEYKTRMEEGLHQKIQSMLDQVLGSNHVVTRVTADLDFNQMQTEQDTYDPDSSVIRSQQRSIENTEGADPTPRGNPDVPINMESKLMDNQPKDQQKKFNRQRETVNYEINRVSRKTVQSPGSIRKLSVAVIVDGTYANKADGSGQEKVTFVPRPPEELKSLEDIVKKAMGYDEARGDQLSVNCIPFAIGGNGPEDLKPQNRWVELLKNNQKLLLNLLLTFLVFFFLIRPFMKKFQQMGKAPLELPSAAPQAALPSAEAVSALEEASERPIGLLSSPREQTLSLIQQDPEKAAEVIRRWMREGV